MNQCPICSQEIEDSFGLIECPGCKKILFADFDGSLKVQDGSEESGSQEDQSIDTPVDEPRPESADFNSDWNEPEPELKAEPKNLTAVEEINEFANSQASSLKEGALIYSLTIKNIDTEELREEIVEILKESKLNIDMKKIKFSLPTLELKDLNPVKVSVIVSRIKHLPVEMEWTQRSVIESGEA